LALKQVVTVSSDLASKPAATVFTGLALKLMVMVSSGLASKPVATVFTSLASKPVATVFTSLASKLVVTVSPGLASKLVVGFLGIQVNQTKQGTFMHQGKYTKDLMKKFNMAELKPVSTPMSSATSLWSR
jgi:hypothetical protein